MPKVQMPKVQMPEWIAADWGTSHLRVWAMQGDRPVAQARSDAGMGTLTRDGFEPALLTLIAPWIEGRSAPVPVMICGMAGARQGWSEAPYRSAPCPAQADGAVPVARHDPRISPAILPGVKQIDPADVMRGEETQIAGFVAKNPDWDGTLVLPGSHCKWVQLSAREIVSFRTTLTGEMFAALADHTVLRHSLGAPDDWDEAAFDEGVAEGMSRPEQLPTRLFSLRAEGLLNGLAPAAARARLSGLLIGAELRATRGYWLGQEIVLIGADSLCHLYARALSAQGVPCRTEDATALTLAGLHHAYGAAHTPAK